MGGLNKPQEILVTRKLEFLARLLEDISQICAWGDFDGGSPQVGGDDHDVRRHGNGVLQKMSLKGGSEMWWPVALGGMRRDDGSLGCRWWGWRAWRGW